MSDHNFLTPAQWRKQFEAELDWVGFDAVVNEFLDQIGASSNDHARLAIVGSISGFMRTCRSSARQRLGLELVHRLEQTGLVSTQIVAHFVIKEAFGDAVAKDFLQRCFARCDSDARLKYISAARRIIVEEGNLIADYTQLYQWHCETLRQRVKYIRLLRRLISEKTELNE